MSASGCWATLPPWARMILLLFLLLPQASTADLSCTLPQPENVHFSSINMHNVLHWLPLNISGRVLYTVKYKMYGKKGWKKKLTCVKITNTWCDLSKETRNYNEQYFANVIAMQNDKSSTTMTEKFNPRLDTTIGAPVIKVEPGDKSISVNWSFPEIWKKHPNISLKDIYNDIKAEIYIYNNKTNQKWNVQTLEINHLDSNTTYCVNVTLYVPSIKKQSEYSEQCVTTPSDHTSEEFVKILCFYVLPMILIIFIITATGYYVYKYIHVSKLKPPQFLKTKTINMYNAITVDANSVMINIIRFEQDISKSKMQETHMSSKQDMPNISEEQVIDDEFEIKIDEEIIKDEYIYYAALKEEISIIKTNTSPYDMPHNLCSQQPASTPTVDLELVAKEGDEYRAFNHTSAICSIKEENALESTYNSQISMVTYAPKVFNGMHEPVKQCLGGLEITTVNYVSYSLPQEPFDANLDDNETLFIEWSPCSHPLYIPNLNNHSCEKGGLGDCTNVEEGLLSKLYAPFKSEDTSEEEDVLLRFTERWELNVEMEE